MRKKIEIGFLVGGTSFEHDFTLKSLNYLINNIILYHSKSIEIKKIYYISKDNYLYVYNLKKPLGNVTCYSLKKEGKKFGSEMLAKILLEDNLFIFSILQGLYGEDGHIQALSYLYQIPGNLDNVLAAAVASNKWVQSLVVNDSCKKYLQEIKTTIVHVNSSSLDFNKIISNFKGVNCILKPNSLGGSIKVKSFVELSKDIIKNYHNTIKYFDKSFLIQERIFGQEIACCCLIDQQRTRILPILKVDKEGVLMDFDEKYKNHEHKWIFHEPKPNIKKQLEIICQKINDVLQFNTYCRFDFIIKNKNIYLLEINNTPGIYENSLFNRSLKKAGFSILDLILLAQKNWHHVSRQNRLINKKISEWNM